MEATTEKRITKKQQIANDRAEAIVKLQTVYGLTPGAKIYTILRHTSSSGMSRRISVVVRGEDGGISDITWLVSRVCDYKNHPTKEGLNVGGCGMDMGFEVVYNLGRNMYPKGFALPADQRGRNGDTSGHDNDGGYAFKQIWL